MYKNIATSSLLKKASSSSSSSSSATRHFSSLPSRAPRVAAGGAEASGVINNSVSGNKVFASNIKGSLPGQCGSPRFLSFSSALRSVRSSVPRWSHGVDWKSPASLSSQIRTCAVPLSNVLYRKIATMGNLVFSKF